MTPFGGNSLQARDVASFIHPYTNMVAHEAQGPLVMTRGEGVFVIDDDGKRYLEAMGGLWCASLGFSERRLAEAAYQQMLKLPFYHTFAHKSTDVSIELAEQLLAMAPVPMSKVFFVNSGSEANDTVVKFVWYYNNALGRPAKKKIISRIKGYHGVTVASASLTGLPNNHRDFDLPIANILHTDCPHWYRFGHPGESEEDFATRMAESLEALIQRERPDTIAAFIAEPVQGAGGVIVPPATYWAKIQPILKKYDILLIADEVICGFGRTGNPWGSTTVGMEPDILSCAKALSAAYAPIGAVMVSERVYQVARDNSGKIGTFGHGYTYSGHPMSCAVALETLKIYRERDTFGHAAAMAPIMQATLRAYLDHPLVGEVRGVGLVAAVELVADKATHQSFDAKLGVGPYLMKCGHQHGIVVRAMGDAIAFCPPLIISEEEIQEMGQRFGLALADTYQWLKDQGHV